MIYKLGIIGLSPGNGHPYSWSAIFNGYDRKKMASCPFPAIPEYLGRENPSTMCIEEAKVTHIWTQDPQISKHVAGATLIENVCGEMTEMIDRVDGVLLARDDGNRHLEMARPFIEANIPIFIDKPLTDQADHLREFIRYYEKSKPIMSCSSMRYCRSIIKLKEEKTLGRKLTANAVTPKLWSTYGVHLIEGIYAVMGRGVESVQNIGRAGEEIVHLLYSDGRHAILQTFKRIHSNIQFCFYGEKTSVVIEDTDYFFSFKNTLLHFIKMLKSKKSPLNWQETVEISKVVIAARVSLQEKGRIVYLKEI